MKDLYAPPPLPIGVEVEIVSEECKFVIPPCFMFDGNWPEQHETYLKEDRGIFDQAEEWGLGYAAECDCPGHRHKDRLVLPVKTEQGKVVSYTCRTVVDHKVRYVEPKTKERADKAALYGAHLFEGARISFVVEGGFDAIATRACLKKVGAKGVTAAALRGSSPSPVVLERLSRFDVIYAMTDPDVAGKKALEALQTLGRHTKVVPVELPDEEDPASLYFTKEHGSKKRHILEALIAKSLIG